MDDVAEKLLAALKKRHLESYDARRALEDARHALSGYLAKNGPLKKDVIVRFQDPQTWDRKMMTVKLEHAHADFHVSEPPATLDEARYTLHGKALLASGKWSSRVRTFRAYFNKIEFVTDDTATKAEKKAMDAKERALKKLTEAKAELAALGMDEEKLA